MYSILCTSDVFNTRSELRKCVYHVYTSENISIGNWIENNYSQKIYIKNNTNVFVYFKSE